MTWPFFKIYDADLNDHTFIKRLSAVAPNEIMRRDRMDFSISNTALRYAWVLLEKYNDSRNARKIL